MADEYQRKMRIEHALKERDVRIAGMIVESVRHALDLLDHQPPSMLEAICDYLKDLQKTERFRHDIRKALCDYAEQALKESRERECRLYEGITGKVVEEKEPPWR
jgi:hypothetical protein